MPIWVLALLFLAQDQPSQTCTLSGIVVNAVTGAPLAKVELLAELAGQNTPPASTFSDAKGNFEMVNLPPGRYRLKGQRNGYLDTYLGARRPWAFGTVLVLEAGQNLKDLQVKLAPFSVVSGTIRDTDGEPMIGAEVVLYRQSYSEAGHREIRGDAEVVTDDQGQYRVPNLPPGRYYIRAAAQAVNDYGFQTPVDHSRKPAETPPVLLPTFYPGALDPPSARTVEVGAGARLSGVDITLLRSRVFHVTVRASAGAGMTLQDAWLFNAPRIEKFGLQMRTETRNRAGEFEFSGVPAGPYTLEVRTQSDGSRARIPLTVGGDLEGVRVVVGPPADVSGRVTVDGSGKVDLAGTRIVLDGGSEDSAYTDSQDNGAFATGVYPGRYQVYCEVRDPKLIVKSIRSEGVDVYGKGLTIADGSKASLEIVLADEGGQVEGVVLDKDDKPAAGATVLLAGAERSRHDSFHEETTDQYGRFHFENVRPGDYKLFAWDDVDQYAWFDPDFLKQFEARGESITLDAHGHSTSQLHLSAH